jgi:hypothetical protein
MGKETPEKEPAPMRFPSIPVLLGIICALILVIVITYIIAAPKVPSMQLLPQISPPPPPTLEDVQSPQNLPSPPEITEDQPPPLPTLP